MYESAGLTDGAQNAVAYKISRFLLGSHEQHTLTLQRDAMAAYAQQCGWSIVHMVTEIGSGVSERRQREQLMRAARWRDIDAIVVWQLDR